MVVMRRTLTRRSCRLFVGTISVALATIIASPDDSMARAKNPIYNTCACACVLPGQSFGTIVDGIQNTAGVPCGAYDNRACTVDDPETGGVRTGTTKFCGGFKPDGVKALQGALPELKAPLLRRGIEEGQPDNSTVKPSDAPAESK